MSAPPEQGRYFTIAGWDNVGTDAYGNQWTMLGDPTGWDDPPEATGDFEQRPDADGAYDDDVHDGARVVTFQGQCISPDYDALAQARRQLQNVRRSLKQSQQVVGHYADGDYSVTAKCSGAWQTQRISPLIIRYQQIITCVDPYKYGPEVSATTGLPVAGGGLVWPLFSPSGKLSFGTQGSSGRLTLTNPGTQDAWPLFTIADQVLGGVQVTDVGSGRRLVYAGDVPNSSTLLVVDSAYGTAELNGADRGGLLTVKQWFPVPAGESVTIQFSTLGAAGQPGQLTASFKPPYV